MEVSEVRRRLRAAIEGARRAAQERRGRSDQAEREYEAMLTAHAVPMFHQVAAALAAEGHRFKVFTPAGSVRLASDSRGDDFIELALDASADPPVVIGRTSRGRGSRLVTSERPVREGAPVGTITDEDVLAFLLSEIAPFVER
jgi:hypothetical protein